MWYSAALILKKENPKIDTWEINFSRWVCEKLTISNVFCDQKNIGSFAESLLQILTNWILFVLHFRSETDIW